MSYINSTDNRGGADSGRLRVCYEAEETNNVNFKAVLYTWSNTSLCATLPLEKHSENIMIKPYVRDHPTYSFKILNDFALAWIFIKNVVGVYRSVVLGSDAVFTNTVP